MEVCAERGLCVGIPYFKHRSLDKYIGVARGQDGVEIKKMIDLVLVIHAGCAAICAGCEGVERDGTRPLRPPCCTV